MNKEVEFEFDGKILTFKKSMGLENLFQYEIESKRTKKYKESFILLMSNVLVDSEDKMELFKLKDEQLEKIGTYYTDNIKQTKEYFHTLDRKEDFFWRFHQTWVGQFCIEEDKKRINEAINKISDILNVKKN